MVLVHSFCLACVIWLTEVVSFAFREAVPPIFPLPRDEANALVIHSLMLRNNAAPNVIRPLGQKDNFLSNPKHPEFIIHPSHQYMSKDYTDNFKHMQYPFIYKKTDKYRDRKYHILHSEGYRDKRPGKLSARQQHNRITIYLWMDVPILCSFNSSILFNCFCMFPDNSSILFNYFVCSLIIPQFSSIVLYFLW